MSRMTLVSAIVMGFCLWAIIGCQIKFNAPILPNVDLKNIPKASDPTKVDSKQDNTEQSRQQNKKVLTNLRINDSVAQALQLSKTDNCVQLVEWSSKVVVVDFASGPCPSPATDPVADSDLKFTALYEHAQGDTYRLMFRGADIGEMELSSDETQLSLMYLCSGRYYSYCYQSVTNQRFSGAPVTY